MSVLSKKMFRDVRGNFSQFITIFLMVFIGVMVYSGIEAYMAGMEETAKTFYSQNNLQDLNAVGYNLTRSDLDKIKTLPHVKDAEGKLELTGTTDHGKTLLLNFIDTNKISSFYIVEGTKFDSDQSGVWLDQFYANENNIKVGDKISIKHDGLDYKEEVRALINVPDHLYDVRDASEIYPDRKEFGFAYISINELPFEPPYSTIMIDVDKKSHVDKVKHKVETEITAVKAVTKIEDSASYSAYQGEIDEGKTYVGVFSGLFLFIALLSCVTTMTRVVQKQRTQIGVLKALGFKNSQIFRHYISYNFWLSLLGSIAGLIGGYYFIGQFFMSLEMSLFQIPNGRPAMHNSSFVMAGLVVLVLCFVTYLTCRNILKENPADTLRNVAPKIKRRISDFTTKGLFKKLGFSTKWNLRDIFRNKLRTLMGLAGVVGCCTLIVTALGMLDSMNHFTDLQFKQLYNFDYKLSLKENLSQSSIDSLAQKYGSHTSKSYAVEIKKGSQRETNNIFITDAKDYVRFVDRSDQFIEVSSTDGVYVTAKLAENNNLKIGDKISWHILGEEEYYTSKIVGLNKDPQNQNITMTRAYFESLKRDYQPDTIYTNQNLSQTQNIKDVDSIQSVDALEEGMNNMLSRMKSMVYLIIFAAIVLGAVIIYNLGILSYTEKEYQFATLKVLGFSDRKIQKLFIKQNNWIAILAIVIGLPLGFWLTDWLFRTAIEESYDFRAYITLRTYIIAAIGTLIITYLVSRFLARRIKTIDMVSSLKGDE